MPPAPETWHPCELCCCHGTHVAGFIALVGICKLENSIMKCNINRSLAESRVIFYVDLSTIAFLTLKTLDTMPLNSSTLFFVIATSLGSALPVNEPASSLRNISGFPKARPSRTASHDSDGLLNGEFNPNETVGLYMDDMYEVARTTDYVREETWSRDDRLQEFLLLSVRRVSRRSELWMK